jgi:hypothetical protein
MSERPSALWKRLSADKRVPVADAFWRDTESPDIASQHMEAMGVLARKLNFRAKSLQTLSVERRAKYLAQVAELSDAVATRALIAYHFAHQRPLMAAFLDALGIAHEDGLITADELVPPAADAIAAAAASLREQFPAEDVDLYLRTLSTLDGDTWGQVEQLLAPIA